MERPLNSLSQVALHLPAYPGVQLSGGRGAVLRPPGRAGPRRPRRITGPPDQCVFVCVDVGARVCASACAATLHCERSLSTQCVGSSVQRGG